MRQHYTNSKGQPVEIATMLTPHLKNARDKAEREYFPDDDTTGARREEIDAMSAEIEKRDAEYEAQQAAEAEQQSEAERQADAEA